MNKPFDYSQFLGALAALSNPSRPGPYENLFSTPKSSLPKLPSAPAGPVSSEMVKGILAALARPASHPAPLPTLPHLSALGEDLQQEIKKIFAERWTERDGQVVPEPENLGLGNDAVKLNATVLYADMCDSTKLVDVQSPRVAAEVYKTYLASAARIIKSQDGVITAYDGDRVMGMFIGDWKNTNAATAALKINWVVENIINPGIKNQYSNNPYQLRHVIGIDTSTILAARIGVRNNNDIVWVGRAANYAAKLAQLNEGYAVYITGDVYQQLADSAKYGSIPQQLMWEQRTWTSMNKMTIYRSNWTWAL